MKVPSSKGESPQTGTNLKSKSPSVVSKNVGIGSGVRMLLDRGVVIPCPGAVEVDDAVDPQRIAPGVVIHAGCRILGAKTAIGPGCELGEETPATVEDCQLGRKVALKGGYYSGATFLDGANLGSEVNGVRSKGSPPDDSSVSLASIISASPPGSTTASSLPDFRM